MKENLLIDSAIVVEYKINHKKNIHFQDEHGWERNIMEKNLTSGSVLKNIISFSLPYFLSYFLQTLYGMADLFIIGQFEGVASTTAVSVGSQVMHTLTVILVGLAMGSTVTIGQAIGAGDLKKASKAIGNTVTLFMVLSVALTAVLLLCVYPIVGIVSTPAEAVEGTVRYLTICFLGVPFITAYNIISSIFRGLGDSKSPMYFIAVACAANIVLDYVFIGVLRIGPAGAALGTTLSQTISVIIAWMAVKKKKMGISVRGGDLRPQKSMMGQLLRVGVPVACQDGLIQVAFIIITIIANRRGLSDAAAVGIVEKVISFVFLVPSSMLSAVSALCAQNIGAGKHDRAAKTLQYAILIAVSFGVIVSIGVQFLAEPVVGLFTSDQTVQMMGGQYFRGYIWDCIFAGVHFSFSGYFCAYGRSELSFLHNITAIVLVRVPGVYVMSKLFTDTLFPMGLATACGSLVSVIICVFAYRYCFKVKKMERK